jgi:hypothetical protein
MFLDKHHLVGGEKCSDKMALSHHLLKISDFSEISSQAPRTLHLHFQPQRKQLQDLEE